MRASFFSYNAILIQRYLERKWIQSDVSNDLIELLTSHIVHWNCCWPTMSKFHRPSCSTPSWWESAAWWCCRLTTTIACSDQWLQCPAPSCWHNRLLCSDCWSCGAKLSSSSSWTDRALGGEGPDSGTPRRRRTATQQWSCPRAQTSSSRSPPWSASPPFLRWQSNAPWTPRPTLQKDETTHHRAMLLIRCSVKCKVM